MKYNPFLIDSCMDYIDSNKLPFNKSVDILIKQEMNLLTEDADEREQAFENAKIILDYYRDFYESRMIQASRLKTYLMGMDVSDLATEAMVENMEEEDVMDKIKELEEGFDEYEDYRDMYYNELSKYTRPNYIQRKNAKKER